MIYIKLGEDLKEELENYGTYDWNGYDLNGEEVIKVIEDLLCEIDNLKEEIEDLNCSNDDREDRYYDDMKLGII